MNLLEEGLKPLKYCQIVLNHCRLMVILEVMHQISEYLLRECHLHATTGAWGEESSKEMQVHTFMCTST